MVEDKGWKILEKLKKITGFSNNLLTSSGDSAIEAAIIIAKNFNYEKIIIPDQGGWFSYRKIPTKHNIEYEEMKTDRGVIIPEELKKYSNCVFIFTSLAGYFAEQPLQRIYSICKRNKILLIEDITGTIGWKKSRADIIVASFSKWKPVNMGYGGLISARENKYLSFDELYTFISKNSFEKDDLWGDLLKRIEELPKRYKFFFDLQKKVKKDLRSFDVVHRRSKGLNVVVETKSDEELQKLIDYCKKNDYESVKCPSYIKINSNGLSIELKRLEEPERKV